MVGLTHWFPSYETFNIRVLVSFSRNLPWRCRGLRSPGTLTVGGDLGNLVSPHGHGTGGSEAATAKEAASLITLGHPHLLPELQRLDGGAVLIPQEGANGQQPLTQAALRDAHAPRALRPNNNRK
eukprot:1078479-Prorocentrum_minimum.AAC.1